LDYLLEPFKLGICYSYLRHVKLIFYAILLLAATLAWTQEDTVPKKRLRAPATANGTIGGESHDSYVIHAEKGSAMSVVSPGSAGRTIGRSSR